MVDKLKKEDLNSRLGLLDVGFSARGLPLRYRPLESFKDIYGNIPDGAVRESLFDPISRWFEERYGQNAHWDGVIGRIPVLWRGGVHLVQVPFAVDGTAVRLIDHIEGLPQDIAATFTPEEFASLGRKTAGAAMSFRTLYNLIVDDAFLDDAERGLVWRGLFDLENAANSLRHVGDTQASIFNTHEAAEKFLKVALKRSGSNIDLQSLGHRLPLIFDKLAAIEDRYSWLKSSVDSLQALAPNMQIRYDIVPRTVEDAISGFNAALSICGTLAQIWLFDIERGTNESTFSPGKFYVDGSRTVSFCKQLLSRCQGKEPSAVLMRLIDIPVTGGAFVVEMSVGLDQSALYLELKDRRQIDAMRWTLERRMQTGQRLKPEDLGIQIASGPEGSYTTALIRIEVRKP